jgi:hypothetical protein
VEERIPPITNFATEGACDGIEMLSEPIGTKTREFENSKCDELCLKDLKFLFRRKYSESFSSSEQWNGEKYYRASFKKCPFIRWA